MMVGLLHVPGLDSSSCCCPIMMDTSNTLSIAYMNVCGQTGLDIESNCISYTIIILNCQEINIKEDSFSNCDYLNSDTPGNLTFEDIGELLFDVLEIHPDDSISFNFNTGRYDTREVKFKPDIDTSKFIRIEPICFKEHTIPVKI